jgi:catechol 2,3-dioxygenase-like lactoylglutathione lyase family enzyme
MATHPPRLVGINHVALEVDDLAVAVRFWRAAFGEIEIDESEAGMAFVDLGDQFVALTDKSSREERHFGLVVDDKARARGALEAVGAPIAPGRRLNARDPFGNLIQVVQYDQIQFMKSPQVLQALALELPKAPAALGELRAKGVRV